MAEGSLELVYALFDGLADGVCVADAGGDVLYMNPAAERLLDLKARGGETLNACGALCGKLKGEHGASAAQGCPLRGPSEATAVAFCGHHGPHLSYNWRGDKIARAEVWRDLRVRCQRARRPGSEGEELHLIHIEDASVETELARRKADWRHMIAHDLRSPLTSVFAGLKLLQEAQAARPTDDKERTIVEMGVRSCRRMVDLLNMYLDVARLEAGAMPVEVKEAALAPIVERAVASCRNAAVERGVSVSASLADGVSALCDAELLERVVANLIDNAIKYNKPGGTVTLTAVKGAGFVRLSVADTGIGIAAKDLPRVFDRYYQAEARRAGGARGNGLGLAFCREALKSMGAAIDAFSQPGQGSEFAVSLAAAPVEARAAGGTI